MITSKSNKTIISLLTLILGLLCLAYLARGFYVLTLYPGGAKDLHARWQEQQYIYRGIFPYFATRNSPLVDPSLGPILSSGYFPWSFFAGFLLLPSIPFEMLRWYYALLNLLSIGVTAIFAYQIGRPYGKLEAWFTVSACLAFSSYSVTLGNGQYGIIINALLIGMFWLLQKKQDVLAALFLGVALLKPTISALYFFVLVIRRKFTAIAALCLYLAATSWIISVLVKVSPISMIKNVVGVSANYAHTGYSSINVLLRLGIPPMAAILGSIIIFGAITLALFSLFNGSSLIFLFAVASLGGRVGTYHLVYDNVMLIFLALALIQLTLGIPKRSNILILTLLLLSLVIPSRFTDPSYAQLIQTVIWLAAFFHLLINQKHFKVSSSANDMNNL